MHIPSDFSLTMSKGPLVSVVICSHNRSADASECLAALIPQVSSAAEVILVDSASSPIDQAQMKETAARYPEVKLIRVDEPGVSLARNRAVELASADWLVFLDDDAVPFPDWLEKLLAVLADASPRQAVIGGGILPLWPPGVNGERFSKRWKTFLSIHDSDIAGSVTEGYTVACANYAIRRRVLLDLGGFSEEFGRIGDSLVSGADSHITKYVLDAGLGAHFDPAFKVYHKISPQRLKLPWILRRTFWEGVSDVRIFRSHNLRLPPHLRPLKLFASLPVLLFLSLIHFRNHDYKIRAAMCLGACLTLLRAANPDQTR
jgi:glycosyltransferase involved in cell wall biosynthesis